MMAFDPTKWKARKYATRDLATTSIANYPTRMEVQMAHNNVSLLEFCTSNTNLYQVMKLDLVQILVIILNFCTWY